MVHKYTLCVCMRACVCTCVRACVCDCECDHDVYIYTCVCFIHACVTDPYRGITIIIYSKLSFTYVYSIWLMRFLPSN